MMLTRLPGTVPTYTRTSSYQCKLTEKDIEKVGRRNKNQLLKGVWRFGFPTKIWTPATRSSLPRNGGSCSLCCVSLWPPPGSCVRPWPPPSPCVHLWPPPGPWPPGFCVWSWPPPLGTQMSSFSSAFGQLQILQKMWWLGCLQIYNKSFIEEFLGIKMTIVIGTWNGTVRYLFNGYRSVFAG
jgi:hypothetical protein